MEQPVRHIVIDGDYLRYSSLSQINQRLGEQLKALGYSVSHYQEAPAVEDTAALERTTRTTDPSGADLVISHKFPPEIANSFRRSVLMLPWEYTRYPKHWAADLREADYDQLWVYSGYLKEVFGRYADPDKIKVLPCGFDPVLFRPDGDQYAFPTAIKTVFLYVGGTIPRKGIDVLLDAFTEEFTDRDDVALVIKDFLYGEHAGMIERYSNRPGAPEIVYHYESVPPETIAAMYRGATCLVHPFRAEGFGLPILEAMASKLPVIATGYGPVTDYADEQTAYLLDYTLEPADPDPNGLYDSIPMWAEPDKSRLKAYMREVFSDPGPAREKAERAYRRVTAGFTWDRIGQRMAAYLNELQMEQGGAEPGNKQVQAEPGSDRTDPVNERKIRNILERNRPCHYEVRVLRKLTDYHSVSTPEVRIRDGEGSETKRTDIVMEHGEPYIPEAVRGSRTEDLEDRLYTLVGNIERMDWKKAGAAMHGILERYPEKQHLLYYFDGIIQHKLHNVQQAVQAMLVYMQHAHYDRAEFRKRYAARYLIGHYADSGNWKHAETVIYLWHFLSPHSFEVMDTALEIRKTNPFFSLAPDRIEISPYWTEQQTEELQKALLP